MPGKIAQRLEELGIVLPEPAAPAANYTPFVIMGNQLFVSGQVPLGPAGIEWQGKCGSDFSVEEGQQAARLCALNLLAQVRAACAGDLDRVRACLRIEGFVNATADFRNHPTVINGASDLLVEVLGPIGVHSRFAVGCASLPLGVAVEVGGIFAISD